MKKVSRRTQDLYMRVLLSAAGSTMSVKASNPALEKLRRRNDFEQVMLVLEGLGLISFVRPDGITFMWYGITQNGRCYFENRARENSERLWTRSLAIIAILISLLALLLEFDDRGYLDRFKPERIPAAQSQPAKG